MRNQDPVLKECLNRLEEYLDIPQIRVEPAPQDHRHHYDVRLYLGKGTKDPYLGIIRRHRQQLGQQIGHMALAAKALTKLYNARPIFFTPWIDDRWAEPLRNAGVFYADAQGNAYFRRPPINIDVRGRLPREPLRPDTGRLIEPSGLKVIHHLLVRQAVNDPYRTIAKKARVALGTVAVVMKELRNAGYIVPTDKDHDRIEQRRNLIDHFVKGYTLKLRPDCWVGRFRHPLADPFKLLKHVTDLLQPQQIQWAATGALGARILTGHLQPDALTLFVEDRGVDILRQDRMLPDPENGNIALLRLFGPDIFTTGPGGLDVATPLLVYAELLHDGRPRELETAQMIFDKYILGDGRHGR